MSSGIISKLGGSEGIAIDVHRTYNVIDLWLTIMSHL
jgi:hypothetical protein